MGIDIPARITDLSSCRNAHDMPIPWTAMREYFDRYDLNNFDAFVDILSSIDQYFLKEKMKKLEREMRSSNGR